MIPTTESFAARLDFRVAFQLQTVEMYRALGWPAHGPARDVIRYIDLILEAA